MAREAPYPHHTVKYTLDKKKKTTHGDHSQKTFIIIPPTYSITSVAIRLLAQDLTML